MTLSNLPPGVTDAMIEEAQHCGHSSHGYDPQAERHECCGARQCRCSCSPMNQPNPFLPEGGVAMLWSWKERSAPLPILASQSVEELERAKATAATLIGTLQDAISMLRRHYWDEEGWADIHHMDQLVGILVGHDHGPEPCEVCGRPKPENERDCPRCTR